MESQTRAMSRQHAISRRLARAVISGCRARQISGFRTDWWKLAQAILCARAVTPCEQGIRQIHCQCKSVFRIEARLPFTPPKVPASALPTPPAAPPETTKFGSSSKRLLRSGCASKDHGNSNFPQACDVPLILSPGVNKLPWCPRQGSKRWPVCGAARYCGSERL